MQFLISSFVSIVSVSLQYKTYMIEVYYLHQIIIEVNVLWGN